MKGRDELRWSQRVSKSKLRRLYESDAKGRIDNDLLTDVGITLFLRCQDILSIYEAKRGSVKCPSCARKNKVTMIVRRPRSEGDPRDEIIQCSRCGWIITWGEYCLSHKRKQLNPGGAVDVFKKYVKNFKAARSPRDKMLAVDRLIHEFHTSLIHAASRPVGVNLIQGKLTDVVEFLDQLTYGEKLPEEVQKNRASWRKEMQNTQWGNLVSGGAQRIWRKHADLVIKKRPSVGREEYLDFMTFQRNDRPLFTEIFGPIIGLKEEWLQQGATPEELDFSAFRYRCEARGNLPINTGRQGGYPEQLIEDTAEYRIWLDGLGRTMKLPKTTATLPLPLDYPVKTMDDWLKIKPWYQFSEGRLGGKWEAAARRFLEQDRVILVEIPGGFDEPRQLMGEEALCLAYYDQPELIHDMLSTIGQTAFQVLERVSAVVQIDVLFVHEDMAGKSGPLAGPNQVAEFIAPYYRKIWDLLSARGARLFDQDSDGDMNPVIDVFLDAGVNCMHPMEPAANMDIIKLREKYGRRLAFYGGIDKHIIRRSKKEIVAELVYKIPPMVETGGCVLALDHRIPNDTSLENYRFYIDKAWEILDRESSF